LNKNVEIRVLIADFVNGVDPKFYDNIMEQVKGLDISIIINNVGMSDIEKFTE
jgi:17beta-estradiol 17-dehydrogenase / very-long-chain 3-oxoacyl-CoA reductase